MASKRLMITVGFSSILSLALLVGSVAGVAAQVEVEPSSPSAGCDEPLAEPGVYDGVNDFADLGQAFRVVVPDGYTALDPRPVILYLAMSSGSIDLNWRWWDAYLDSMASIFVMVEQTDVAKRDPAALAALVDRLTDDYCIDTRRIHAFGGSASSATVKELACAASDRIASVFIGIGYFAANCTPERPVPIVAMTGDPDRGFMDISVGEWSEAYGCDQEPTVEDLGAGVERTVYNGCAADIVLYDIEGGPHGLFRHECEREDFDYCYTNEVFDVVEVAEQFFAAHPLPAD